MKFIATLFLLAFILIEIYILLLKYACYVFTFLDVLIYLDLYRDVQGEYLAMGTIIFEHVLLYLLSRCNLHRIEVIVIVTQYYLVPIIWVAFYKSSIFYLSIDYFVTTAFYETTYGSTVFDKILVYSLIFLAVLLTILVVRKQRSAITNFFKRKSR